jgi:hypothetical protein
MLRCHADLCPERNESKHYRQTHTHGTSLVTQHQKKHYHVQADCIMSCGAFETSDSRLSREDIFCLRVGLSSSRTKTYLFMALLPADDTLSVMQTSEKGRHATSKHRSEKGKHATRMLTTCVHGMHGICSTHQLATAWISS